VKISVIRRWGVEDTDQREREKRATLFRSTGFLLAGLSTIFLLIFAASLFIDPAKSLTPARVHFLTLGFGIVFFLISALVPSLNWIQPILLLLATPIPLTIHTSSMFSLGAFIAAEILLARLDFFRTRRIPKYLLTILYFYSCEFFIGIQAGQNLLDILSPIIFMTIFLAFLLIVYGDRWKVSLVEPKPSLSLGVLRISTMEAAYLKALLSGLSFKEIAIDGKVKESTVRNTLAHVYKKFDVPDKASLMAKCEKYRLID
jgi:DNA-binding CsgD family transcriptional regulator